MNVFKKWLALFALSFGYASMYTVPYAKYVFYDPMQTALGATNLQLGAMVSLYAFLGIFTYIPGGWVADRFSPRKTISISLALQGLMTTWFALNMNITVAWIVFVSFAFTNCFAYWAATLKGVRLLGSKDEQGKLYGFFEAGYGLSTVIISTIALGIFAKYVDQVAGFKMVVLIYSGFSFLAAILIWFLYEEHMEETAEEQVKPGLKEIVAALKNPSIWLISIVIMTTYGLYVGQTYLTPYLTAVVGITVAFSGGLAILRTYGVKLLAGPGGGWIADKIKSPCKVLVTGYILCIALLLAFYNLGGKPSIAMVMALMLVLAFVGAGMKGIMWSTVEESKIPRYYTGIAIGLASILGYMADIVYGPLFGYWMDNFGNGAYNYIFAFLIGSSVLGLVATLGILKLKQKAVADVEVPAVVKKAV